jgi:hypothetical protein
VTGRRVKLAFVGDICLSRGLSSVVAKRGPDFVFGQIRNELSEANIWAGNFECCLVDADCSDKARQEPMAISHNMLRVFNGLGHPVMNLANNHLPDCRERGITLTRQHLKEIGIPVFGAGANLSEALEPVFVTIDEASFGFVGFGDTSRYYAGASTPGIAPMEWEPMAAAVRQAIEGADFVTVSLHADLEFGHYPAPWRVDLSRRLIDIGAHLVVQHHPHVLQGIEHYRDGLIAYSLGNFVFNTRGIPYMENLQRVSDSMILQIEVDLDRTRPRMSWRVTPIKLNADGCPDSVSGKESERITGLVVGFSEDLSRPTFVQSQWLSRCWAEAKNQLHEAYSALRHHGPLAFFQRVRYIVRSPEHRRWQRGLLSLGRK